MTRLSYKNDSGWVDVLKIKGGHQIVFLEGNLISIFNSHDEVVSSLSVVPQDSVYKYIE